MNAWFNCEPEDANAQPPSVEAEAVARIRLVAWVSIPAELILAAVEVAFFPRPDWLTIEVQSIWFVCSLLSPVKNSDKTLVFANI